jgi:hypothetical protein
MHQDETPALEARVPDSHRRDSDYDGKPLRVSHTMIGVMNPMADLDTPKEGAPPRPSTSDRPRRVASEEPVDLPTQGLPPPLMATLVLSAMLLAALLGYLALR